MSRKLTHCCRSHVQVSCPYDGFLLVEVPDILLEMNVPFFLLVQGLSGSVNSWNSRGGDARNIYLQTSACVDDIGTHNIRIFEL